MDQPSGVTRGLAHRVDDLSPRGALWVGVVTTAAVLTLMTALVVWVTRGDPTRLEWQTGTGIVGSEQVSVLVDGRYVGATDAVPLWIDAVGSRHHGGWPTCLAQLGTSVTFRFATVAVVTPEGDGQTPIVAVDCRQP